MNNSSRGSPDKEDVRSRANGKWGQIISSIIPQLADAIDAGHKKKVACPFHDGATQSNFRVLPDFERSGGVVCNTCGVKSDGFATLVWAGLSFDEAVRKVNDWLGGYAASLTPAEIERQQKAMELRRIKAQVEQERQDKYYRRRLNKVWGEAVRLDDPAALPARLYFNKRGLTNMAEFPPDLRFHPSMKYLDAEKKTLGYWPTILARLTDPAGRPVSILRIFVERNGDKPRLPERKKLMSAPSTNVLQGAAIRLTPVSPILGVAEGVETALAVKAIHGINCWSTFSAQLMESFIPPPGVQKVLVFADKDMNGRGENAALKLVERLWSSGVMAGIRMPEDDIPAGEKGFDWLDWLNTHPLQAA